MKNQQPEALALASIFEIRIKMFGEPLENPPAARAAKELRRLHAINKELEAMLESVGAGGVSAQRVTQGKDHIAQPLEMVAAPGVLPEPEAYLFQHEETGQTMFVEAHQVEWGFEANNPRLQKISGVYTEQQVRELLATGGQPQADAQDAERYRFIKRKLSLIGNGDGTCAMQALNLPARILGWPDVGELAIAQFLDAAIDAAIAVHKEKTE